MSVLRSVKGIRKPLFSFQFQIFYSDNEVSLAHLQVTVAPEFFVILLLFLRNWFGPLRDHMVQVPPERIFMKFGILDFLESLSGGLKPV
jgi:hypothetical protein